MDYEDVKTFKELLDAINCSLKQEAEAQEQEAQTGNCTVRVGALHLNLSIPEEIRRFQQDALRLRAENPFLPPVQDSNNVLYYQNYCIDAIKIIDEKTHPKADAATENNKGPSMAKMVRIYIDQNPKITLPDCKKKVNVALKLQGKIVSPNSIRNAFYDYKKHLRTKLI